MFTPPPASLHRSSSSSSSSAFVSPLNVLAFLVVFLLLQCAVRPAAQAVASSWTSRATRPSTSRARTQ
eukprot:2993439-Pyramimonas_sp.AAC.1